MYDQVSERFAESELIFSVDGTIKKPWSVNFVNKTEKRELTLDNFIG
jgi:hypothetical protein